MRVTSPLVVFYLHQFGGVTQWRLCAPTRRAGQIKIGTTIRSERTVEGNCLLEIESSVPTQFGGAGGARHSLFPRSIKAGDFAPGPHGLPCQTRAWTTRSTSSSGTGRTYGLRVRRIIAKSTSLVFAARATGMPLTNVLSERSLVGRRVCSEQAVPIRRPLPAAPIDPAQRQDGSRYPRGPSMGARLLGHRHERRGPTSMLSRRGRRESR